MADQPVDLDRVRAALADLDRIAAAHPELCDPSRPPDAAGWAHDLEPLLENDKQLVARVPSALVDRIDAYAQNMREQSPGMRFSRADAVRVLLTLALDRVTLPTDKG